MNVLVNLLGYNKGGGQQVAMNFASILIKQEYPDIIFHFFVTRGTIIHDILKYEQNLNVVKSSPIRRIFYERFLFAKYVKKNKIDIVLCLLGLRVNVPVPCVIGSALSNIYFPEKNFWGEYPFFSRWFKKLKDIYRRYYTLKADAIIFENESLRNIAISKFGYPQAKTIFIKPSISTTIVNHETSSIRERCKMLPNGYLILMLTGWHKNKNIEIVPNVIFELLKYKLDFYFIITVNESDKKSRELVQKAKDLGVADNVIFFGSVQPYEVETLVKSSDIVALLSLLESFSNNIIEAWSYKRALLISDESWSHSICKDAAAYCGRSDPKDIANKIIMLRDDKEYYATLIAKGEKELLKYPKPEEKVLLQIDFLRKISDCEKI